LALSEEQNGVWVGAIARDLDRNDCSWPWGMKPLLNILMNFGPMILIS